MQPMPTLEPAKINTYLWITQSTNYRSTFKLNGHTQLNAKAQNCFGVLSRNEFVHSCKPISMTLPVVCPKQPPKFSMHAFRFL